jgi:ribosomal protein S18 acetylase RimI-like enzyme
MPGNQAQLSGPVIMISTMSTIACVQQAGLEDDFFRYLHQHLQDNGSPEVGYFQPLPRSESRLTEKKEAQFRASLKLPFGTPGWRKIWVARSEQGEILGHVDLRARPETYAFHRCLLGMGVARAVRRQGLGQRLLAHASAWATAQQLEWIDLQVLQGNLAAIALYRQAGFIVIGETPGMYKIDGNVLSLVSMSRHIQTLHSSAATLQPAPLNNP